MPEQVLHSLDDYARALRQPRVLLFKHSPACPISAAARAQYDAWRAASGDDPTTAFVDVIADRAVARGVAAQSGVAHQSPQAILFVRGRPAWHASHGAISADALHDAWTSPD